jgi:hypothetical protein
LEEVKQGHTAGPFNTADEMIASLKRDLKQETRPEAARDEEPQVPFSMRVDYANPRVVAALKIAPANVSKAFYKQVRLLAAKYMAGSRQPWTGRSISPSRAIPALSLM